MTVRVDWGERLRGLAAVEWPAFVSENSGLPGPRANLALVEAVAGVADAPVSELLADGGEFATMCAAAFVGSRADDPECELAARALASDDRWRVREGVAIGLQHLGDRAFAGLVTVARRWTEDSSPLVQRAAVAAVCEPRLLRERAAAEAAIEMCRTATASLMRMPRERRAGADARTLRQALGYCWSVAVAGDPEAGLPAFQALDVSDVDVAWIVTQNRRKKRLADALERDS